MALCKLPSIRVNLHGLFYISARSPMSSVSATVAFFSKRFLLFAWIGSEVSLLHRQSHLKFTHQLGPIFVLSDLLLILWNSFLAILFLCKNLQSPTSLQFHNKPVKAYVHSHIHFARTLVDLRLQMKRQISAKKYIAGCLYRFCLQSEDVTLSEISFLVYFMQNMPPKKQWWLSHRKFICGYLAESWDRYQNI